MYTSCKPYSITYQNLPDQLKKYIINSSNNIALFTTYTLKNSEDSSYVYDKPLYSGFNISSPIQPTSEEIDLLYIKEEFIKFSQEYALKITNKLANIDATQKIVLLNHIRFLSAYLEEYFKYVQGKLHILLLYNLVLVSKIDVLYTNKRGD